MSAFQTDLHLFGSDLRERCSQHLERHQRREIPLEDRRAAAVAVVLLADEDGRGCFLITRRASNLRRHSGQWALPGGRVDPGEERDEAALRELSEEVGLELSPSHLLGCLDDYATRSGFVITPFVVWSGTEVRLKPDPTEVAAIHRVPLATLDAPEVPILKTIPESDRPVIAIPMLETEVHAPTAAILYQLREVCLWGRDTPVEHFEQPVFAWR